MEELVSVYIITFNRLGLLKRALDSVMKQTYSNLEIIIGDDCSTDGTDSYIKEMSMTDSRIKFTINKCNKGACYSRNVAINASSGKYITGLDDDDYFLENRISNFMANVSLLDKFAFIYSDALLKKKIGIRKGKINVFSKDIISSNDLLYYNFAGNQVFTKSALLKDNNFDESLLIWQDFECWYNILSKTKNKAKRIKGESYVQDISHEGERITSGKKDKVINSFEYFSKKHNLSRKDKIKLSTHLSSYHIRTWKFIPATAMIIMQLKFCGLLIALRGWRELVK